MNNMKKWKKFEFLKFIDLRANFIISNMFGRVSSVILISFINKNIMDSDQ